MWKVRRYIYRVKSRRMCRGQWEVSSDDPVKPFGILQYTVQGFYSSSKQVYVCTGGFLRVQAEPLLPTYWQQKHTYILFCLFLLSLWAEGQLIKVCSLRKTANYFSAQWRCTTVFFQQKGPPEDFSVAEQWNWDAVRFNTNFIEWKNSPGLTAALVSF